MGKVVELIENIQSIPNMATDLSGKQDKLVSGTNIKTISGANLLGTGDMSVTSGGSTITSTTIPPEGLDDLNKGHVWLHKDKNTGLTLGTYINEEGYWYDRQIISGVSAAAGNLSMVITDSNDVYAVGSTYDVIFGLAVNTTTKWTKLNGIKAKEISSSGGYLMLIDMLDDVYVCGNNSSGQLGLGHTNKITTLTSLGIKAKHVCAGYWNSALISLNDLVYTSGNNSKGQLGLGDTVNRNVFTDTGKTAKSISMFYFALGIIDLDSKVYVTGENNKGQLGLGDTVNRNVFTDTGKLAKKISIGREHSMMIGFDNLVYSTGSNSSGQLGLGDTTDRLVFTTTSLTASSVFCFENTSALIDLNYYLYTVGYGYYGTLALGDNSNRTTFTAVNTRVLNVFSSGSDLTVVSFETPYMYSCGKNYNHGLGELSESNILVKNTLISEKILPNNKVLGSDDFGNLVFKDNYTGTKLIDETGIGDKKVISYNSSTDKLEYTGIEFTEKIIKSSDAPGQDLDLANSGKMWVQSDPVTHRVVKIYTNEAGYWVDFYVLDIRLGNTFAVLLASNNDIFVTGHQVQGALGLGSTDTVVTWTKVPGIKAKAISCGYGHTMIIDLDDYVLGTGANTYGQLGLGNTTWTQEFTSTGVKAKSLSCGRRFSAIIALNDQVNTTGYNDNGQLGDGTMDDKHSFYDTGFAAKAISCGSSFIQAIKLSDNILYSVGNNIYGQLGLGDTNLRTVLTSTSQTAKAIAAGEYYILAIDLNDEILGTGYNGSGQLGLGDTTDRNTFTGVNFKAKAICSGNRHSLAVSFSNTVVYSCGGEFYGQLSRIDGTQGSTWGTTGVKGNIVAAGDDSSFVYDNTTATLYASGKNTVGQLGLGTAQDRASNLTVTFRGNNDKAPLPLKLENLDNTPATLGSSGQVLAVNATEDGVEFIDQATGGGSTGSSIPQSEATIFSTDMPPETLDTDNVDKLWVKEDSNGKVEAIYVNQTGTWGMFKALKVASSTNATFIIDHNNNLYVAGDNMAGNLGVTPGTTWTKVPNLKVKDVAAALGVTLVINLADDNVYSIGKNSYGQLGLGDTADRTTFIDTGVKAKAISCSSSHSMIIGLLDDHVYTTGYNTYGALGLNDQTDRNIFTDTGMVASSITCGTGTEDSMLINLADNHVYVTGKNSLGQFGLGDTNPRSVFTDTGMIASACALEFSQAMVINLADNHVYTAGRNGSGQLGLGDTTNRNIFVDTGVTASSIAVGESFSTLVGLDGYIYSSGDNSSGQLGLENSNASVTSYTKTSSLGNKLQAAGENAYNLTASGELRACGFAGDGQFAAIIDNLSKYTNIFKQSNTVQTVLSGVNTTTTLGKNYWHLGLISVTQELLDYYNTAKGGNSFITIGMLRIVGIVDSDGKGTLTDESSSYAITFNDDGKGGYFTQVASVGTDVFSLEEPTGLSVNSQLYLRLNYAIGTGFSSFKYVNTSGSNLFYPKILNIMDNDSSSSQSSGS